MLKNSLIIIILLIALGLGIVGFKTVTSKPGDTISSQKIPSYQSSNNVTSGKTYTTSDVSLHKDATSCWSSINGKVYDLTSWIDKHPGGKEQILSICGQDGSGAFIQQHGGQNRPENELATFLIGTLAPQSGS